MKEYFVKHKIDRHILQSLAGVESLRFSDLRPPKTETNLLTYHIKQMVNRGLVEKENNRYFLTQKGVSVYNLITNKSGADIQAPDMSVIFVIQNSDGDLLLQKRSDHPYFEHWSLPHGPIVSVDKGIKSSAEQISKQDLGVTKQELSHAGNAYIKVRHNKRVISYELAHVFKFDSDKIKTHENLIWARPHKLSSYKLAPGVNEIVARTFFNDPFFFEEFDLNLYN